MPLSEQEKNASIGAADRLYKIVLQKAGAEALLRRKRAINSSEKAMMMVSLQEDMAALVYAIGVLRRRVTDVI